MTFVIPVVDSSQVGQVRRAAARLLASLAFDETQAGRAAIVVTEVATNLVKHGRGGDVIARRINAGAAAGLQILALDRGPGIENVGASLRDGYSTAGTPGTGLGAVRRLSSRFDIYSQPGAGTAVLSEMWTQPPAPDGPDVGAVSVPKRGETECGDGWAISHDRRGFTIMVVDGLGHGTLAARASAEAIRAFHAVATQSPRAIIQAIHEALRATRGAAVAVASVDGTAGVVRFAGVGNIAAVVVPPTGPCRHMVSHNGTAGHEARRIEEFTYPWPADGLLVMQSDGLTQKWDLDRYPGLARKHPALIAGILYRDFHRAHDDATVVVARASAA
jgi:anti-sigma regulatory factor (Ser/Thr protein kinase)